MRICGQEFSEEVIGRIRHTVSCEPGLSRRAVSVRVCQWLDWKGVDGKPKEMSCRVALLKLHRKGLIDLPEPATAVPSGPTHRGQELAQPQISPICAQLHELGGVELVSVKSRYSKAARVWKSLVGRYHPLGGAPLCGAQLRYLIRSPRHGWLGAVSFSSAAWRVKARDEWIGWKQATQGPNLQKVVCLSRLLILPQVKVANLASHALSLCAKTVPKDWRRRYGDAPVLLETFVERDRFRGTCFRAANWQRVGKTRGRGRQDRDHNSSRTVKDVYVYPLRWNARQILCGPVGKDQAPLPPGADWAQEEFGGIALGDKRLNRRALVIARDFFGRPEGSIPQACRDRAKAKAAYRFFDHPETTMEALLSAHYPATVRRLRQEKVVLAVQDTTHLNYSAHPATEKLGPIAPRPQGSIGLMLHDTMAFNAQGTPLGLLDVQCWARDPQDFGKKKRRRQLPIEEKESNKWLTSFRKLQEVQRQCHQTRLVSVGDREADIYELFELACTDPSGPKLLVRASVDRLLKEGQGRLWAEVSGRPASDELDVKVPRKGSRPARVARLEVRFARVALSPPLRKPRLRPLEVWAVLAREVEAPAGVDPLEWMLLTTAEVTTFEQAKQRLCWYTLRWQIEVYHRTLKSGCKIEQRQLGHADRIESSLAIDLVVAWRIFHLVKLGREVPDVACSVFFEEAEWKALVAHVSRDPTPPARPPALRQALRMVATLGGFLGRKCDGEPGTKSLWLGLQYLDALTSMWTIMTGYHTSRPQIPPVYSNPGYG